MPRRPDPRKRTTSSGAPAQPIGPTPGQQYGAGVAQMALQRDMPAPQLNGTPTATIADRLPEGVSNQAAAAPAPAGDPYEAAMAAAQDTGFFAGAGSLRLPTTRRTEPFTHGLPSGPGAGPEVLGLPTRSPTATTLERLTAATGDPMFAELARRAGL